jgi:flagellar protein FlaG
MLIQNTSSAVPASRFTSDSAPVSVAAPRTKTAAVELQSVAAKAVAEQQATQPNGSPPSAAQVQSAVDSINKVMLQNNSNVEFSIDKDTKQTVIKVVESKSGDVIKQYPSEEVIAIAREIDRVQQGLLLRQKA